MPYQGQIATTAPIAKSRILAAMVARSALADVRVAWGGPTENEDVNGEMIHLGEVNIAGEWRTLGAGVRHETYTIGLHVVVFEYGDNEAGTEQRAFVLLNEASAALTANRMLSDGTHDLLTHPAAIQNARQTNVPMVGQWGARVDATILCQAMFTP